MQRKGNPSTLLVGMQTGTATVENSMQFPQKLNMELPFDPAILLQGLISTNWQAQNREGGVKNSIGNGAAKELLCTTHGHELREGIAGGNGVTG